MFNQGNMELNDYREKFNNIVQIIGSYDVELYERKQLVAKAKELYPVLTMGKWFDQLIEENESEYEIVKQVVHDETVALAFISNSNKDKYGHIMAELHDDFLKKTTTIQKTCHLHINSWKNIAIKADMLTLMQPGYHT